MDKAIFTSKFILTMPVTEFQREKGNIVVLTTIKMPEEETSQDNNNINNNNKWLKLKTIEGKYAIEKSF